jgi:PEP-CTERM/exosortase A-associated glycosyltransferase
MRILHVLDHSLPHHSGYVFRTLSILREQRALGWETLQLTTPRHGSANLGLEHIDGWAFYRTPLERPWIKIPGTNYLREMTATARRIEALVTEFAPDVIHCHSPCLNALPALWLRRRSAIPVVYEMRASWEDAAVDHGTTSEGSVRYRVSRALENLALRKADQVTTICEGLRREIVARGIGAEKVTVIPNAVDIDTFAQETNTTELEGLRLALGLKGATVLGFAGSYYGYEGLDLLLDAFGRLLPARPELRLLLLGGGPQEDALRRQAAALGIEDRVIFRGRVPQEQVPSFYGVIDILVYPRRSMRLTELVTPLKPLEAMARGRIVAASDVGGHRELIRDQETGYLFKTDDPGALAETLDKMLSNREQWPQVIGAARHFVETERTWKRSVSRYAEVYARLVNSSRAAQAT